MKFILLLFIATLTFGQTTPYTFTLDRLSGMPSDMIFDVYQDRKNFTWFASTSSISRFDGLMIKNYESQEYNVKSVSNITEDEKGRIWFQNFTGSIFYIEDDKIKHFSPYKANGFLRFGIINNKIYVAGKEGVNIYRITDFKLISSVKLDIKSVKQTIVSQNKFYLLGSKIEYIDDKIIYKNVKVPKNYDTMILAPVSASNSGSLYIFSKFNNNYAEVKDDLVVMRQLPFNTSFTQNANVIDDKIWICSTKGIYKFDPKTLRYQLFFPDVNVSYIIKTKNQKHWISTFSYGALYIEDFNSNLIKTPSTPLRMVNSNNEIYFTTLKESIYKLSDNFQTIKIHQGNSDHTISPLLIDSINNRLLFTSSQFTIKSKRKTWESTLAVKHILQLDTKYYAISSTSWNGVIYINPNLKSQYDDLFFGQTAFEKNGIHFIPLVDFESGRESAFNRSNKTLYFITNYGLKIFSNKRVKTITNGKNLTLTQLGLIDNQLFVLSESEQLYKLNDSDKLELFAFPEDFSNSKIKMINIINNNIYIHKEQAVYSFNPKAKKIKKIIDIPKGLDFYDLAIKNNQYYFSSNKGIIQTFNNTINATSDVKLKINTILINGTDSKTFNLLDLQYDQNNVEIKYDIVSAAPNNNYTINYRINDGNWETLDNNIRTLKFLSLSYNKHNIELKITNGKQIITEKINLYVNPPFWKKTWFIATYIILLFMLGYTYFKAKLSRVTERNKKELEKLNLEKMVNQSKLKSLKSQMNPHFFFNALNTLQSYILSNEKTEAISYLSKFSKLTRSILEMSEMDTIPIEDEVQTLKNYLDLEKGRFNGDFSYHIDLDDTLNGLEYNIPTLLLQPFVENAIKHGLLHKTGKKNLLISFTNQNQFIKIIVDDDGIGRERSAELNNIKNASHVSFATQSLQQRIELLNINKKDKITLTYTDKHNKQGTIVTLLIPKIKPNYESDNY